MDFDAIFSYSKQLIFFCKSNIAQSDKTATREWPPACVDSNCSNQQLFECEIFDVFSGQSWELYSLD